MARRELLREVNERIVELYRSQTPRADVELLCECGREGCDARAVLPLDEFERVAGEAGSYVLAPEHVRPHVDHALRSELRYVVVGREPSGS